MMNTAEAAGAAGTLDMKYVLTCVLLMALVIYSTCSSGYDFPETDPFEVYPIFLRLYAVCSAGSTDISGCIYLHRTSLFGGRRNDRSGDFGI